MLNTEFRRVQRESRSTAAIWLRHLIERAAIFGIATERMPRFGQMNANLMCASRLKATLDLRVSIELFQRSHMRDRELPAFWFRCAAPFSVTAVTNYI